MNYGITVSFALTVFLMAGCGSNGNSPSPSSGSTQIASCSGLLNELQPLISQASQCQKDADCTSTLIPYRACGSTTYNNTYDRNNLLPLLQSYTSACLASGIYNCPAIMGNPICVMSQCQYSGPRASP